MTIIIMVLPNDADKEHTAHLQWAFNPNKRGGGRPILFTDVDTDRGRWAENVQCWEIPNEDHVQKALEQITKWWPSHEVGVFRLETIAFRPLGDVGVKEVSKAGILPADAKKQPATDNQIEVANEEEEF